VKHGSSKRRCSSSEAAPTKFWLATVDHNMSFPGLVDLATLRGASRAIITTSSKENRPRAL
jgi:hypothetical protein